MFSILPTETMTSVPLRLRTPTVCNSRVPSRTSEGLTQLRSIFSFLKQNGTAFSLSSCSASSNCSRLRFKEAVSLVVSFFRVDIFFVNMLLAVFRCLTCLPFSCTFDCFCLKSTVVCFNSLERLQFSLTS